LLLQSDQRRQTTSRFYPVVMQRVHSACCAQSLSAGATAALAPTVLGRWICRIFHRPSRQPGRDVRTPSTGAVSHGCVGHCGTGGSPAAFRIRRVVERPTPCVRDFQRALDPRV